MECEYNVYNNYSKSDFDRKSILELENILVFEVSSSDFRTYMISIEDFREDGSTKRIMLGDGSLASSTIKKYQRRGGNIRCCSVFFMMKKEEFSNYSKFLEQGNFDGCLDCLIGLEESLNKKYGFQSKGKSYHR